MTLSRLDKKIRDETRNKVLNMAGEVFAEAGYQAATVRDICARAGVNIAAVNYHFGDKLGLYTEILKSAVGKNERSPIESASRAPTPEKALRYFLQGMLLRMNRSDRPAWYTKVMAYELAQPTPALAAVVEHVIKPNSRVLCDIVSQIIGRPPLDRRTRLCAHSIIGQVIHYAHARPVLALLWPELKMTPRGIEMIADHIAEFSLEAMKGLKLKSERAPGRLKKLVRRSV